MNEINNQSLRPATARASSVTAKPKLSTGYTAKGNDKVDNAGGKTLPHNNPILPQSESRKQPVKVAAESAVAIVSQEKDRIEAAVAKMNEFTQSMQRDLRFSLDEASGRTVVTVMDRESKEVIRQIPDETFLEMARNLNDYIENHVNSPTDKSRGTGGVLHLINAEV